MAEPIVKYCTVREGDSEWHLECRFSDGQKYAAIKIDEACPELATRVAALLNGNVWTDERPSEPGEYWAALHPHQRERLWASQAVMCVVIARNEHGGFLSVRWFDADLEECSLGLDDLLFDGAKWSRRETPADPFEETKQ